MTEKEVFEQALGSISSLSINEMLVSGNAIVRALSLLDSRLGKRRLSALQIHDDEHPLVRQFYDLRCEAEGIRTQAMRPYLNRWPSLARACLP